MLGFGALGQFALGEYESLAAIAASQHTSGGWDPYRYKARSRRRKTPADVARFLQETEQLESRTPAQIAAQAEAARRVAEDYLARQAEADQAALTSVLHQINEFYRLLRAEIQRREQEDDEDLLRLSS